MSQSHSPRIFAATLVLTVIAALGVSPGSSAQTNSVGEVRVMTQNLYLGADVGIALALLPDVAAAAQALWNQVVATDFTRRAPVLAGDVAAVNPAVIGLQEATTWLCTPDAETDPVPVFDFTAEYLAATAAAGTAYVIASAGGAEAFSPGYAIDPIVGVSLVTDPETFQPLFGMDTVSCGFRIADALLVRADLADQVLAVNTRTYDATLEIVPGFITVQRGYAWADLNIDDTTVRFVTTHLESVWEPEIEPNSVIQARQLVADLVDYVGPLVVMGDFNADPRDPRQSDEPNPGGQPEASAACDGRECNAYWTMVDAGFVDAGPDAIDPANATWGADALLAGPNLDRVAAALVAGNSSGYTDRLDYVFVRNGVTVSDAEIIGDDWPTGPSTWQCDNPAQVANTSAAAEALGVDAPEGGVCIASDHAAIVATISFGELNEPNDVDEIEEIDEVSENDAASNSLSGDSGPSSVVWIIIGAVVLAAAGVAVSIIRRRRT